MAGFRRTTQVLLAAFSQQPNLLHEWLPGSWNSNFESFKSVLLASNVRRIGFLRHGQTGKAQNGIDFDRVLTDHGREQAREAGVSFGQALKPFYSSVLSSPAPRTTETTNIFLQASGHSIGDLKIVTPQELYDGSMQPKGSALFKEIGYAPLEKYLNNPEQQKRLDAQLVLGNYSSSVIEAILRLVTTSTMNSTAVLSSKDESATLWIVGHAIYLPAAALGVASLVGCNDMDVVLSMNTKEAEGYLVDVDDATISYLSRPSESDARTN